MRDSGLTSPDIVRGKKMSATLYKGDSSVVALAVYDYILGYYNTGTPMSIAGVDCTFAVQIKDIKTYLTVDHTTPGGYIYKVTLEGELV